MQQHLRETKSHAKQLDRRIKKLGGGGHRAQTVVGKAMAAAKGPMHMVRGSGEQEKMLKNAKTEYFNEHEEIATYLAIETLATKVGDRETAKLAKGIRREEERMAKFLEGQIKSLTGAVVSEEVPRAQRSSSSGRKRSSTTARKRPLKPRRKNGGRGETSGKNQTWPEKSRAEQIAPRARGPARLRSTTASGTSRRPRSPGRDESAGAARARRASSSRSTAPAACTGT